MTLNDYITQVRDLLHDDFGNFYSDSKLTRWINRARKEVAKVGEHRGTDAVELIESGRVHLVVNTPRGRGPRADGIHIRTTANVRNVPCLTTVAAARAAAFGIAALKDGPLQVTPLQDHHANTQQRLDV